MKFEIFDINHVGMYVYKERIKANLTQAQLGAKCGMNKSQISAIENMKLGRVNFNNVKKVFTALGVGIKFAMIK